MLLCSIDYFHQVSSTSSARSHPRLPGGQSPSIPWDLLYCSAGSLTALKVLWRRHICLQWESRTSKVGTWTWQWYLVCSSTTPAFPVYSNVDEKVLLWIPSKICLPDSYLWTDEAYKHIDTYWLWDLWRPTASIFTFFIIKMQIKMLLWFTLND